MRVIAIDPGYGRCGVAIMEKESGRENVLYSACIETPSSDSFGERLQTVVEECERLMKTHAPGALALEQLYFNTNQKTVMHVAEVRGALIYIAGQNGLKVFEYTPGQVKAATTGWGKADKKAVAQMIRTLLKIEKTIHHDDEYDALAIGITHLACAR